MDRDQAGELAAARSAFRGQRVAIVHDWFQGFHGSERVVEAMLTEVFTEAAVVDLMVFHAAHEIIPEHLSRAVKRESSIARLPLLRQKGHDPGRWRYLLPYMPRWFSALDLTGYDIVIASSHSVSVNVRPPADALFACYCHTPMRYAWMPEVDGVRVTGAQARVLGLLRESFKRRDLASALRVGGYVTNSTDVKERIRQFYGREAEIVFPPVDVHDFDVTATQREPAHFLWVHRMVSYKQPELVLEAFRGSPNKLTMVGVGPVHDHIREIAPPNVAVHGWLERDQLAALYGRASAFIHVGEEDFGITMVEALAAGIPVVGINRGGARDIVRDGIDGVLLDEVSVTALRAACDRVAQRYWPADRLVARAAEFSRGAFALRFSDFLVHLRSAGGRLG